MVEKFHQMKDLDKIIDLKLEVLKVSGRGAERQFSELS